MNLLGVEIRRALRRRLTRVLVLIAAAVFAISGIIAAVKVEDLPPSRVLTESDGVVHFSRGGQQATVQIKDGHIYQSYPNPGPSGGETSLANESFDLQGQTVVLEGEPGAQHVSIGGVESLARFTDLYTPDHPSSSSFGAPFGLLAFFTLILGASLVGADWKWNMYTVLLTWETRRTKFFSTRILAEIFVAFSFVVLGCVLFAVCMIPTVMLHGNFSGMNSHWSSETLYALFRMGLMGSMIAVGAASIAMIGRGTVAAILIATGYLLIVEHLLIALRPGWWFFAYGPLAGGIFGWEDIDLGKISVTPTGSLVAVLGGVALLAIVASVTFRRRDVVAG